MQNAATIGAMYMTVAIIPGPSLVMLGWIAATQSRRDGLIAVFGIMTATFFWIALAASGTAALSQGAFWPAEGLRAAGALCLIWMGYRTMRKIPQTQGNTRPDSQNGAFLSGLMTTLANPISAVFWTSIFATTATQDMAPWRGIPVFMTIGIIGFAWYGAIAVIFSMRFSKVWYLRLCRRLNIIAGLMLLIMGFHFLTRLHSVAQMLS